MMTDNGGFILPTMEESSSQVVRSWQRLSLLLSLSLSLSSKPSCRALTLTPFAIVGGENSNHLFKPGDGKDTHSDYYRHRSIAERKRTALNLEVASDSDSPQPQPQPVPSFARDDETDSEEELASVRSWKSTSAKAKEAEIVHRAPSLLDDNAFVEAKKRSDGWHTLGVVGGPTKSIYHGVFRKDEDTGLVDPYALGPSEYIRTMASVVLCLSAIHADGGNTAKKNNNNDNEGDDNRLPQSQPQQHEDEQRQSSSSSPPTTPTTTTATMRFLHMGYGSGSLMRFLRHAIPGSQHEAIELDPAVVKAASDLGLFDSTSPCEKVVVGDALEYGKDETKTKLPRFHGVCIDVFDGANLMPPGFYSVPFLETLRDDVLGGGGGESKSESCAAKYNFVIHNFHVGTERLQAQLEDAMASYRTVFGSSCGSGGAAGKHENENKNNEPHGTLSQLHSLYRVDSLNTNNHGGNTILIVIKKNSNTGDDDDAATATATSSSSWVELAALATERWEEKRFNVASRIVQARPF
jgi:hypothetical protein